MIDVRPARQVTTALMCQNWESLTFLHWRYDRSSIQARLPVGLEVDAFDGSAWIGLTAFHLTDLKPPHTIALPWISNFPETNLRTYVRGPDGESGIWFFSLDAARLIAVLGARVFYGLPYRWSAMRVSRSGESVQYASRRHNPWRDGRTKIRVLPGRPIAPDELERFLTARFRLYTTLAGRLAFADVEHEPWPLHEARIELLEQDLLEAAGLTTPNETPLVHYSPGVHVRIGRPRFI